jgi:hypothetical protein
VHDVVRLGDELHIAVLDAIVHHLDIVAGATRPHIGDAGLSLGLGGDGLKDRLDHLVRLGLAAGHDGRPPEGALFAAGDAGADIVEPLGQSHGAALGVLEERVAAVDDQVARLEQGLELGDDLIHRPPP